MGYFFMDKSESELYLNGNKFHCLSYLMLLVVSSKGTVWLKFSRCNPLFFLHSVLRPLDFLLWLLLKKAFIIGHYFLESGHLPKGRRRKRRLIADIYKADVFWKLSIMLKYRREKKIHSLFSNFSFKLRLDLHPWDNE